MSPSETVRQGTYQVAVAQPVAAGTAALDHGVAKLAPAF